MQVNPYLMFNGNCAEALKFYEQALGAKIEAIMPFEGSPAPSVHRHARFHKGSRRRIGGVPECRRALIVRARERSTSGLLSRCMWRQWCHCSRP